MSPKYSFRDMLIVNVVTLIATDSMGIGSLNPNTHSTHSPKKKKIVKQDCLNIP